MNDAKLRAAADEVSPILVAILAGRPDAAERLFVMIHAIGLVVGGMEKERKLGPNSVHDFVELFEKAINIGRRK